jgi:manganese/zinc/iron transport system permease protein
MGWIVLTAVLLAAICGLLGSFLLLRRMALVGDVVSHAVVPGIVVAYLWSGMRELAVMFLGAVLSAGMAVGLVQVLRHRFGWHSDTALAAVLSSFFACGVLLLSAFGKGVDLDVECVLYGEIAYVPLDMVALGGMELPWAVVVGSVLLGCVLAVVLLAYKELVVSAFDPEFAATIGIWPALWQTVLLVLTAVVSVVGFELVGAILTVALLIVPAATARLVTVRIPAMVVLSVLFGSSAAVAGCGVAMLLQGAIAGWIAVVGGVQFAVVLCWSRFRGRRVSQQAPSAAEGPFQGEGAEGKG